MNNERTGCENCNNRQDNQVVFMNNITHTVGGCAIGRQGERDKGGSNCDSWEQAVPGKNYVTFIDNKDWDKQNRPPAKTISPQVEPKKGMLGRIIGNIFNSKG